MLADNIIYLKKNDPDLLKWLNIGIESETVYSVKVENSKSGIKTIRIEHSNHESYLHSKYDPIKEAQIIIDQFAKANNITDESHIVFWGLGLGYHLEELIRRYPNNQFSIYEPSKKVFLEYLNEKKLSKLPIKRLKVLKCGDDVNSVISFCENFLRLTAQETLILELPSYQKSFERQRDQFFEYFKQIIKEKKNALKTDLAYKKRWIINSVVNFDIVLRTPNILMQNHKLFQNQNAILVSAGPSLDLEIENLKKIKQERLAYIFSVGSAINTLIENDIYPDAVCTYDPQGLNQQVFKKVNERGIKTIPMIFGTSVGFETIQQYTGPKYHMITSQDTVAQFFLKDRKERDLVTVCDAPSIAVLSLELLEKLGFAKIILVGQNLAFKGDSYYASGIDYKPNPAALMKENLIQVNDVNGTKILTSDAFNQMRLGLEARIEEMKISVINTTVGGAAIKGTEFKKLDVAIDTELNMPITEDFFCQIQSSNNYDEEFLFARFQDLKIAYEAYKEMLLTIKQLIIKTDELVSNKNIQQSEKMYAKIDQLLGAWEKNHFAAVFEIPMNRVEHEILANEMQKIHSSRKGLQRISEKISCLSIFIDHMIEGFGIDDSIIFNLENALIGLEMKKSI